MSVITEEMFREMLKALDEDGDGTVTKDEFKGPYIELHVRSGKAAPTNDEFEQTWKNIDKDGDGTLSCEELASHFGFNLNESGSDEMSEEQILAALSMQAFLFDDVFKKLSKESSGRRKSVELERIPKPVGPKQTRLYLGVTTVRVPQTIKPDEKDPNLLLLYACEGGDKSEIRADFLETKKLTCAMIYIEDDAKGETPLIKMCRHGLKDEIRDMLAIVDASKQEDAQKYYINLQDKQGKSAAFFAVEYQRTSLVDFLLTRGADCLQQTNSGWNILHQAVSAAKTDEDVKTVGMVLTHERVAPYKAQMVGMRDGNGRMPIHIASFKGIDAITQLLLKHGADPSAKDGAGNDGVVLAERSGRRRSKEILEEFLKTQGS